MADPAASALGNPKGVALFVVVLLLGGMSVAVMTLPSPTRAQTCAVTYDPVSNLPPNPLVISSSGNYCFDAGTYNTQITILASGVALTSTPGTPPSQVVIQPASVTNNAVSPSGAPQEGIIYVEGVTGVTIANLTVDGSVASSSITSCGSSTLGKYIGVLLNGASGTVEDTTIMNLYQASPSLYGCQDSAGAGIYVETPASGLSAVTVYDNTVTNYQKGGIVCNFAGSSCTITGNTVSPLPAATAANAPNGIQIGYGATGTVSGNTVSGNVCTIPTCLSSNMITSAGPSVGILLYETSGTVPISGNTVTGNDAGIFLVYDTGTVNPASNVISDSTYVGVVVYDESQTVAGNTFSGNPVGIEAVSDNPALPATAFVSGNSFSGGAPYSVENVTGASAQIIVVQTTTTTLTQTQVSPTTITTTTASPTTTTETQVTSTTTISTTTSPTTTTTTETQTEVSPTTTVSTTTTISTTTSPITRTVTNTATTMALSTLTRTQTQTLSSTVTQTLTSSATLTPTTSFLVPPLTIVCSHNSVVVGGTIKCEAKVLASSAPPTGKVVWSSSLPGRFSPVSCKLSRYIDFSICMVTFTPKVSSPQVVLTAKYGGDTHNQPSMGTYNLAVTAKTTETTVSCSRGYIVAGSASFTCKARMAGYSPTGIVTWAQSGTGAVVFASKTCTLSGGSCTITITPSRSGSVIIGASYLGDNDNQDSAGTIKITIQ